MLPDAQLSVDILTKSSRWIASNYDVGRTTVNTHRVECLGIHMPKQTNKRLEQSENQSMDWSGSQGVWNTGTIEQELTDRTHEDILRMFGHNPEKVAIKGVLRESHKEYWSRDLEKMLWKHSYSYSVVKLDIITESERIDAVQLLNELTVSRNTKPVIKTGTQESTFVLDWADWQFAKMEGGGTPGLIRRLESAFADAVNRIEELRNIGRNLDELVIIGGGDMVEGCVIYPNQSYEIDGNRREQIRGTAAMILQGLTTLAPLFKSVRVVVVPGNHGEHRIAGNRTTIGDNDDLLVFEIAELACKNDPKFAHVKFDIAEKEMSVITKIYDWNYGITHGDVYGKGSGTGVRNKVFNWFKTMAANRHPIGSADVMVTHHFHHEAQEDWGNTLWVQNPTMDGGSHYYAEYSGHKTRHGMASWVATPSERLQDKQILR